MKTLDLSEEDKVRQACYDLIRQAAEGYESEVVTTHTTTITRQAVVTDGIPLFDKKGKPTMITETLPEKTTRRTIKKKPSATARKTMNKIRRLYPDEFTM